MEYYVYYSHQKIMQLFRQLPESRCAAMKVGGSGNNHNDVDFHPGDFHHGERREGKCLQVARICRHTSDGRFHEYIFDPNDMYQLRRVLEALRRAGRLCGLEPCLCPAPGDYVEFCGLFAPEEAKAPDGSFWLYAPGQCGCPAVRLLCCEHTFCGEREGCARWEVWCCGAPLPLHGVMLVLACGQDALCGLPLFLAI
ncbi:MAG: hypothetical protein FWF60_00645 [Oscillospiraceae bacterium]|nr:hypothetical protein [Oscillospiraceae bacterium]